MRLSKEEYARKRIHNGCLVRIENKATTDNYSVSLVMPNSYPRDGIFNPHLTTIKNSYSLTQATYEEALFRLREIRQFFET